MSTQSNSYLLGSRRSPVFKNLPDDEFALLEAAQQKLRGVQRRLSMRLYWPEGLEHRDKAKLGALAKLDRQIIKSDPPRFLSRIPASEVNEVHAGLKLLRAAAKAHEDNEFYSGHAQYFDYGDRRRQQLGLEALRDLGESTLKVADQCRKAPPMKLDFYQW